MMDRDRNKTLLLELQRAAGTGNDRCADCGEPGKGAPPGSAHGPDPPGPPGACLTGQCEGGRRRPGPSGCAAVGPSAVSLPVRRSLLRSVPERATRPHLSLHVPRRRQQVVSRGGPDRGGGRSGGGCRAPGSRDSALPAGTRLFPAPREPRGQEGTAWDRKWPLCSSSFPRVICRQRTRRARGAVFQLCLCAGVGVDKGTEELNARSRLAPCAQPGRLAPQRGEHQSAAYSGWEVTSSSCW